MQMPITISMNSVSFPKSEMLSHLSRFSHNCGTDIRRMAATETRVRNRRFTRQSYHKSLQALNCLQCPVRVARRSNALRGLWTVHTPLHYRACQCARAINTDLLASERT